MNPDQLAQERAKFGIPAQGYGVQPTQDATAQRLSAFDAAVAAAAPPKSTGFVADVKTDLAGRGQQVEKAAERMYSGEQGKASTALQVGGAVAGGIWDIAGNALKAAKVPEALHALAQVPGPLNAAMKILQEPHVQEAISKGKETYDAWKTSNPKDAANLESVVNIASLIPIGAGAKLGGEAAGEAMQITGKGLQASAKASAEKNVSDYALELVRPEEDKSVLTDEVKRTTEKGFGPFRRSIVKPTAQEAHSADEVSKIPGINPKATLQRNYNVIKDANTSEAKNLESQVAANDFMIPRKEVVARMNRASKSLQSSPLIVGDAQKMAAKLIAGAQRIINENKGSGKGLLKAKKEYDRWVLDQKPKAFDAKAENAFTIANREVRDTFKDILDKNAPNAGVKASLAKQTALYNAMDNIAPKAAYEANTAFGRALQKAGDILGTKNKAVQTVAAIVGIGGLGAAATFAPVVAYAGIPAYLAYRGGKLLLRPGLRDAIGKILETAGGALNPADRRILRDAIDGKEIQSSSEVGQSLAGGAALSRPLESESPTSNKATSPNASSI